MVSFFDLETFEMEIVFEIWGPECNIFTFFSGVLRYKTGCSAALSLCCCGFSDRPLSLCSQDFELMSPFTIE